MSVLLLIGGGAVYAFKFGPFAGGNKPIAKPSETPKRVIEWSLKVVGDAKAQTGKGASYSTFLCDQGVIKDSLQIKELTNPPASKQPKISLISGDARCGKDFDTILVTGEVDTSKKKRDYVIAGSTKTGFIIQYEYSLTITN
jgi:hypothetical protein